MHDIIRLLTWPVGTGRACYEHSVLPTPALNEMATVRCEDGQIAENPRRDLLENSSVGECVQNAVRSRFVLSYLPCPIDRGAQQLRCLLPMLMISSYVVS